MADTPLNENTLNFFKQFEDSTKKIEPVNSGLITNPDEEDFNFWETVGGLSLSAAQGVVNAVEETGDFIDENILNNLLKFTEDDTVGKICLNHGAVENSHFNIDTIDYFNIIELNQDADWRNSLQWSIWNKIVSDDDQTLLYNGGDGREIY